jgi:putative transposase
MADKVLTPVYAERNPVRANLVALAEEWRWSSAWRFYQGKAASRELLCDWPIPRPRDWRARVNRAETQGEFEALRRLLQRGQPFGSEA